MGQMTLYPMYLMVVSGTWVVGCHNTDATQDTMQCTERQCTTSCQDLLKNNL